MGIYCNCDFAQKALFDNALAETKITGVTDGQINTI